MADLTEDNKKLQQQIDELLKQILILGRYKNVNVRGGLLSGSLIRQKVIGPSSEKLITIAAGLLIKVDIRSKSNI